MSLGLTVFLKGRSAVSELVDSESQRTLGDERRLPVYNLTKKKSAKSDAGKGGVAFQHRVYSLLPVYFLALFAARDVKSP